MRCDTCEKKISAQAPSCPHCGHAYPKNYWPLRHLSETQLWIFGITVWCAILAFLPRLEHSDYNWIQAFVVFLVSTGVPMGSFFYVVKLRGATMRHVKLVFIAWFIGIIGLILYWALFFPTKS